MIRFLWGTDPHFKDDSPASRKDDWTETLLDKFRQIASLTKEHDVDAVLLGGDVFDISTPSLTSHALVQRMIDEFRENFDVPILCNVGNHDVKYQQLRFLDQMPLGTMFSSGVFTKCFDEFDYTIQKEGVIVRVVGVPYHGVRYDKSRISSITKKDPREHIICMAHLLASPKGGKMFEGEDILSYSELEELNPNLSCINFGHWHKNQGITRLPKGTLVVNNGSLSRGSLSEDNIDRIPSVALIEVSTDGVSAREIPLRVKPSSEVFDLEKREKEEKREALASKFIETLLNMASDDANKESVELKLSKDEIPSRVREKAREIWNSVLKRP